MFHRILKDGEEYFIPPMALSCRTFRRLMEWTARTIRVVALEDTINKIRKGKFDTASVAVTFDDGYRDNFELARRILLKAGIPATFFVPIRQIEAGEVYWWDHLFSVAKTHFGCFKAWLRDNRLPATYQRFLKSPFSDRVGPLCRSIVRYINDLGVVERNNFLDALVQEFGLYDGERLLMTWNEISQLKRDGFSIGSHSLSHIPLTELTTEQAKVEIKDSRAILSNKVDDEIEGFSYPRGRWNGTLAELAAQEGYSFAVTTRFGSNNESCDLYALARRNLCDYKGVRSLIPVPMHMLEMTGLLDRFLVKRRTS